MNISYQWLSEYVDLSQIKDPDELARILTSRGLEVEEVKRLDQGFEKVVAVKILKRDKHPQADRLSVCEVTTGSGDPLQIVCGAQNMKAGDIVCLAQIGAVLPNGLKIEKSKIRGVESFGMLCSEEELKLKDTSEGILILPETTKLGQPLADILGLKDTILTLKLTANRGDCLSHFGLAREVASAIGKKAKFPEVSSLGFADKDWKLGLEAGEGATQFYGCLIEGVKVSPSPDWLKKRLESIGLRSINNIVDATNFLLMELGQPVHAYDADKLSGKTLIARAAQAGEKLPLLNGTTIELKGSEIVIADDKQAVGLAGVMGGGNSEVSDTTQNVFLECAQFNASQIRKASSLHGLKSDASSRFEKGIDSQGVSLAMLRLKDLVIKVAGGKVKGSYKNTLAGFDPSKSESVTVLPVDFINRFLGTQISNEKIVEILEGLECKVSGSGSGVMKVVAPSYRQDMKIKEDLAEEVARTIGYDAIPSHVPKLTQAPTDAFTDQFQQRQGLIERTKDVFVSMGCSETLNYSFLNKNWLSKLGVQATVKVANPLSEDHEWMAPSLLPGLIKNLEDNESRHFGSEPLTLRVFELRPVFWAGGSQGFASPAKLAASSELNLNCEERLRLSFVLVGPRLDSSLRAERGQSDFFDLKGLVEGLIDGLQIKGARILPFNAKQESSSIPESAQDMNSIAHLFHPGQSAELYVGKDRAGFFGLLHPGVSRSLKLRTQAWICELDWEVISKLSRPFTDARKFKSWGEFPSMERDFALLVKDEITSDKIINVALKAGRPLAKSVKVFDIYRGAQVFEGMTSVAVRVIFNEDTRSLQEAETEGVCNQILAAWKKELGVELRS